MGEAGTARFSSHAGYRASVSNASLTCQSLYCKSNAKNLFHPYIAGMLAAFLRSKERTMNAARHGRSWGSWRTRNCTG